MDLDQLRAGCLGCQKCGLCATRTNVVFGTGVADAEVMFIGEGPGQQEDGAFPVVFDTQYIEPEVV